MASSMDNFDKLMMAMALKHIVEGAEDLKLHPFTCEIIARIRLIMFLIRESRLLKCHH